MADNWARTIFGTSARPRYGSTWSIVALVLIGLVLALIHSYVLAIVFWVLGAGAAFVRNVRRST